MKWSEMEYPWQVCFEEAWHAYCAGSLPIGAALFSPEGQLLFRGRNHINDTEPDGRIVKGDLAHAEINVLLQINRETLTPRHCTLYTLLEPCPLCLGAFYMSGVRHLSYAARDTFAGSTNLLGKTPYLSRKKIYLTGPISLLEPAIVALQVAAHLRRGFDRQGWADFYAEWEATSPAGMALGVHLYESGRLQAAADAAQPISQVYADIGTALAEKSLESSSSPQLET